MSAGTGGRTLAYRTATVALVLAFPACTGRGRGTAADQGPGLALVDSITVAEADSLYVGRAQGLAAAPGGGFYVSDAFAQRAILFDGRGSPVRVFGGRGEGPGEFTGVDGVFAVDSTLVVVDQLGHALNVFDARQGRFVRRVPFEGIIKAAAAWNGTVWLGDQNVDRKTGVAVWNPRSDRLAYMPPLPPEYLLSPELAGIYDGSSLAAWSDSLLVGFTGSNDLFLANDQGAVLGTVGVPVRRRRGIPPDFASRLKALQFPEMFSLGSMLFDLHRLSDGRTALVHFDQTIDGRLVTARVFLSLLSADRRRACVDGEVPVSTDSQPLVAFRGDTLLVLEQRITSGDRPVTILRSFRIDDSHCDWIPTGGRAKHGD